MEEQTAHANELEEALANVQAQGDDVDWDTKTEVLRQLALNSVYIVVDQALDADSGSEIQGKPAFVSNGDDMDQAMLAIFSTEDRARTYIEQEQLEGHHPLGVPGPRALLAIPDGVGIRINPNQEPGFAILPALAERLRDDVKEVLSRQPN